MSSQRWASARCRPVVALALCLGCGLAVRGHDARAAGSAGAVRAASAPARAVVTGEACGVMMGRGAPMQPIPGAPITAGAFPLRSGEQVMLRRPDGRRLFGGLHVQPVGTGYQITWTAFATQQGFALVLRSPKSADLAALTPGTWSVSAAPGPVVGPLKIGSCSILR